MAKTLRFNRRVPDDIRDVRDWYAKASPAIARRFQRAVDETFVLIAADSQLMAVLFDGLELRAWKVPRFPHVILYRVEGNFVVIEALRHSAGDPEKWRTHGQKD